MRSRTAAVLVGVALMAAACGARANRSQVSAAARLYGGGAGGGGLAPGQAGADSGGGAGGGGGALSPGQAPAGAGSGGAGAATGAAASAGGAAGAGGGPGSTLPPGGNGGATDVGVTGNSVTVANISILTGPVPGLFAGAVNGTDAFLQYQNSLGGVFGRRLNLAAADDQFDCGQNKALTESYLPKAFAFVGSFSLFDNCGAQVISANPGVPDVHNALALDAQKEPNNFSSQPIRQGSALGPIDYFKAQSPGAVTAAASLIGDVQSAKDAWVGERAAMVHEGYQFSYERIYEPTETDFTADVVQMRAKGVKLLILIAADVKSIARIESAAAQQNFHPQITALGASAYDPQLIPLAGAQSLEGVYLYLPSALYLGEDRGTNKEVDLFLTWLKRTHPNANADLFTAYGWASARLFVEALQAAGQANGGKATRAGVLAALKNIHKFDSNGLLASGDPAGKGPPTCYVIIKIQGGKFVRVDDPPGGFRCDGTYFLAGG